MAEGMKDGIRTVLNKRESKRLGKDVYSYKVPYRTLDGKQTSETFSTFTKAKDFRDSLRNSRNAGIVRDFNGGRISVREYALEWLEENTGLGRVSTEKAYRTRIHCHIIPQLGGKQMRAVTTRDIQKFVKGLSKKGLMPNTVHGIWQTTAKIFNHAHKADKIIGESPCTGIILPEVDDHDFSILTWDEIRVLAEKWVGVRICNGKQRGPQDRRYRAAVLLAGATGLRVSEIAGLTWDDIDLERRTVTVKRQLSKTRLFAPPKSRRSRRTVPFSRAAAEALRQHREEFPPFKFRIGWVKSKKISEVELVFYSRRGNPATAPALAYTFAQACANGGHPGVTFHALRHSFASSCIQGGLTILELRDLMGHSSVQVTGDVYGHLFPHTHDRLRLLFDDTFS